MNSALHSSARGSWCTPPDFVERVRKIDRIGLDPCSNSESFVGARTSWTEKDDGLRRCWRGHGLIYVNPPYGREIVPWVERCAAEGLEGSEIVALLPARTDTRWFQDHAATATELLFLRGRLTFVGAESSAPFPSVVCYWGGRGELFRAAFSGLGVFCRVSR